MRILVEISKFRIRNKFQLVSSENFYQVSKEVILTRLSTTVFENFSLIGESRAFLVCDLEDRFIDLSYVFLKHLSDFLTSNNLGSNFDYRGFLNLLKGTEFEGKTDCFLIEVDEEEEKTKEEEAEMIQQDSLAKRSSSSTVRLTSARLGQMAAQVYDSIILGAVSQAHRNVKDAEILTSVSLGVLFYRFLVGLIMSCFLAWEIR